MKKLISSILIICMMVPWTVAFAEDNTMTVDQAVEYALSHSDVFSKQEASVISSTYSYYQAKIAQKSLKENKYLENMTIDMYLSYTGYYTEAAKLGETVAKRGMENLKKQVSQEVKNKFFTYLNSVHIQSIAKENMDISYDRMTAAKKKLDMGVISPLDYKSFELVYEGTVNSYNQATRDKQYNLTDLKNTMNYPLDKDLVPVGEFEYEIKEPLSQADAIKLSRSGNTYLNIADNFALAQLKWTCCSKYYLTTDHGYKIEEANMKSAESDFRANVNSFDMTIRSSYNSLVTMKEQLDYSLSYVQYLKDNADAMYVRYQMGMVTANDWRQSQQEYYQGRNDYDKLRLAYYIASLSYEGLYS